MKKSHSLLFSYGVAACLGMGANGLQAAEPLMLQKVMKDLGRNMQAVTDGISREDWTLIEKQALLIADHPQPPLSEKVRIMGFVGTSMTKYKAYDGETHEAAQGLGRAARGKDGTAVINAFQKLQNACFNCHREFRKPFVEHFYGQQLAN